MPGFPLLDVAIGMAFIYLLLSLICSSVSEGLESFLRNRATDLESGIRNLLGDRPGSWWNSFLPWVNSVSAASITREFYRHPLIRSLFGKETRLPAYIPSRAFALAVMDMTTGGTLLQGATQPSPGSSGRAFVNDVNGIAIPESLKRAIQGLVIAADGDAQQARANIEEWFNASMDRVSGWYKARTQKILFAIGVVVTVVVNADSLAMFRNLSVSKNLQTIVSSAQSAGAAGMPQNVNVQQTVKELKNLDLGNGWAFENTQSGNIDETKIPPDFKGVSCKTELRPCEAPILWSFHLLFVHGIGWLITAAALALGAPFWFDTLNRIIVVRSTVKPSEKSSREGSKDPAAQPA